MDSFYIEGGNQLNGECSISCAKNAMLPILAGSILCGDDLLIKNCAMYSDVNYMLKILEQIGCYVKIIGKDIYINPIDADKYSIDEEYMKKIRSSIFMLGPLLARFRKAKVSYPGGCNIGLRPIDLHIDARDVW